MLTNSCHFPKGVCDPTFSSIEEYLGRNTQDYYKVLAEVGQGKWNPQNGTRPWIRLNLIAHYRQAGTALRRARMIRNCGKNWNEKYGNMVVRPNDLRAI